MDAYDLDDWHLSEFVSYLSFIILWNNQLQYHYVSLKTILQ